MEFNNNKHIDYYFKKGLKDYSQVPDDTVWENIERRLYYNKKVKQMFFFRVAAGLLVFIGLATFLAFEAPYFSSKDRGLASMNLNEELQIFTTGEAEYYSGNPYNSLTDSNLVASDIRIPHGLLFNRSIKSQIIEEEKEEEEEPSTFKEDSLVKLTAYNSTIRNKNFDFQALSDLKKERKVIYGHNEKSISQRSMNNFKIASERNHKDKFSLSGSFSPIMSYRHSKTMASNVSTTHKEESILSYSGGMEIGYSLADELTLRTGVHYTKMGQSLNKVEVNSDSYAIVENNTVIKIANSIGEGQIKMSRLMGYDGQGETPDYITYTDKSATPEFTIEPALYQTFEMVKMPFMLEYTLLDDKFDVSMIGGFNANLLVDEGIFIQQAEGNQRIGSTKDLRKLNYSGTLGIGLKYDLGDKAQLFMQPSFDYYITSLSSNNSYRTFPYYFGFFSGVSISL